MGDGTHSEHFVLCIMGRQVIWLLNVLLLGAGGSLLQYLFKQKGKKFAIIGPVRAGKTTFIRSLCGKAPASEYEGTWAPTIIKAKELLKFEIPLDDVVDLPGDKDAHKHWEKQASQANVIVYLFDAHRIVEGETRYIELVTGEIRHVNDWRKERTKQDSSTRFFIVATHIDQIADYRDLSSEPERSQYVANMWKSPIFERLNRIGGGAAACCLAANLANSEGCERLKKRIVKELEITE